MPTVLGDAFAPSFQAVPPGMSKLDSFLWEEFRKEHFHEWKNVFYNCRLGSSDIVPGHYSVEDLLMWHSIAAPRIDAIVEREKDVLLIEVRPNASRDAFGACQLYYQLYEENPILNKPYQSAIVTNFMTSLMQKAYKGANIMVFIVLPYRLE